VTGLNGTSSSPICSRALLCSEELSCQLGIVRGDSVDARVNQRLHSVGVVDGPNMQFHTVGMNQVDGLRCNGAMGPVDKVDAARLNGLNLGRRQRFRPQRSRSDSGQQRFQLFQEVPVERMRSTYIAADPVFRSMKGRISGMVARTASLISGTSSPEKLGENQAPASSCLNSAKVMVPTSPLPLVVRSTVPSCIRISWLSNVTRTSNSTQSAKPRALLHEAIVFSGAAAE